MFSQLSSPIVFCDVETTGGSAKWHRVTEIACIKYQDGIEVDRFSTLINPETSIPFNIQMITGIDNTMVAEAPHFSEIAQRVVDLFEDAIFCAHNVRFDYNFIGAELARAGYQLTAPKLCTVQLSRKLFPEERGHSLSKIIDRYNFTCDARHRALGDTEVLVQFAKYIEAACDAQTITQALAATSTSVTLPPNAKSDLLETVPHTSGVYLLYGKDDELLYVGKSVNIYKRLLSHFSNANHNTREHEIWNNTYYVETQITASEMGALLLELHLIKTKQPHYNRRSRKTKRLWRLEKRITDAGYIAFTVRPFEILAADDFSSTFGIFKTKKQIKETLGALVHGVGLCPKLLGIETGKGACFSYQLGICNGACVHKVDPIIYNIKVEQQFAKRRMRLWSHSGPKELVCTNTAFAAIEHYTVDNWTLLQADLTIDDEPQAFLPPQSTFDYEMYKVLIKYL